MTGDGEPNAGLAMGKGEESRGLVRATAGWSLFRKFSLTWLYLCCQEMIDGLFKQRGINLLEVA